MTYQPFKSQKMRLAMRAHLPVSSSRTHSKVKRRIFLVNNWQFHGISDIRTNNQLKAGKCHNQIITCNSVSF